MVGIGLPLLLSISVVIVIVGVVLILIIIINPPDEQGVLEHFCADSLLSDLTDISDEECVVEPRGLTNKRFTATFLPHVVAVPYPVSYKIACATICNSISVDNLCIGDDDQMKEYDKCIDEIKPDEGCQDLAVPIARVGNTVFYLETYYGDTTGPNTAVCQI